MYKMVTEMITLKLEDNFLKEIDSIVSRNGFQNRTEFIRSALRDKLDHIKLREAMISLGGNKHTTTDDKLEELRLKAFNQLDK